MRRRITCVFLVILALSLLGCGSSTNNSDPVSLPTEFESKENNTAEASSVSQSPDINIPDEPEIDLEAIKDDIKIDFIVCTGKGQSKNTSEPRNDFAVVTVSNQSKYNLESVKIVLNLYKDGKVEKTVNISVNGVLTSTVSVYRYEEPNHPIEYDNFTYEISSVSLPETTSTIYGTVAFDDIFECYGQINGNKAQIQITNRLNETIEMNFWVLEYDSKDNLLFAFPGSTAARMYSNNKFEGKTTYSGSFLLDVGCKKIVIAPEDIICR